MKLSLNTIKSKSGTWQDFVLDLKVNNTIFTDRFCEPQNYGKLIGKYMYDGRDVLIKAKGEIILNCACARCGEKTLQNFEFDFEQTFFSRGDGTELDSNLYFFGEDDVDLTKAVEDTLITNLPSIFLCSENCKGLCPKCYCNLNYEKCDCDKQKENNNPFANVKL